MKAEAKAATRDRASTFGDVTLMKNSVFVPFLCIPRETTKTISISLLYEIPYFHMYFLYFFATSPNCAERALSSFRLEYISNSSKERS